MKLDAIMVNLLFKMKRCDDPACEAYFSISQQYFLIISLLAQLWAMSTKIAKKCNAYAIVVNYVQNIK